MTRSALTVPNLFIDKELKMSKLRTSASHGHPPISTPKSKAKKLIRISLSRQMLEAFEGESLAFRFPCVSGDKDHPTDRGTFKILRMHKKYRSRTYNARMDYAMFFTLDGKAIHQYHGPAPWPLLRAGRALSDWVGSHGCVRLTEADAKALYQWSFNGLEVRVS